MIFCVNVMKSDEGLRFKVVPIKKTTPSPYAPPPFLTLGSKKGLYVPDPSSGQYRYAVSRKSVRKGQEYFD